MSEILKSTSGNFENTKESERIELEKQVLEKSDVFRILKDIREKGSIRCSEKPTVKCDYTPAKIEIGSNRFYCAEEAYLSMQYDYRMDGKVAVCSGIIFKVLGNEVLLEEESDSGYDYVWIPETERYNFILTALGRPRTCVLGRGEEGL